MHDGRPRDRDHERRPRRGNTNTWTAGSSLTFLKNEEKQDAVIRNIEWFQAHGGAHFRLPNQAYAVLLKIRISADQRHSFKQGLHNEHAVKRISVMSIERSSCQSMLNTNRKCRKAGFDQESREVARSFRRFRKPS